MIKLNQSVTSPALPASGGQELKLDDFRGRKLVVYFYPKDHTPGCTRESQAFRDHYAEFQAAGCDILGVSRDGLTSHDNFRAKHDLPFHLIADRDEVLCKLFDVIREKNMYGRKVMGIERSTFLIDEAGVLRKEWRKVRVPGHVEEVLKEVNSE